MRDTALSEDIMDFLTDAPWRICSTYHAVLKVSPGTVTSGQDMLMNIPHVANFTKTGQHKQQHIDTNIIWGNERRSDLEYVVGGMALIKIDGIPC